MLDLRLFLFIVIVVGALASGSTPTEIQDGSVLKIDLSSISEIVTTDELSSFIPGGSDEKPISLSQALASIRKAKADSRIRGIYLNVEGYSGGMASTADLREALKDFRSSGKFIISYADSYDPEGLLPLVGSEQGHPQPSGYGGACRAGFGTDLLPSGFG